MAHNAALGVILKMFSTKDYRGARSMFYHAELALFVCGCWKLKRNATTFKNICYFLYSQFIAILSFARPAMYAANLPVLWKSDFASALGAFSKGLYTLLLFVKIMFYKTKPMVKLIDLVMKDEVKFLLKSAIDAKGLYEEHTKICETMAVFTIGFTALCGVCFAIIGVMISEKSVKLHLVNQNLSIKLPLEFYYFLDKNQEAKYHAWLITQQVFSVITIVIEIVCVQTLNNSIMIFFKARIRILQLRFRNFGYEVSTKMTYFNGLNDGVQQEVITREDNINSLVKEHQELISIIEIYNKTTQHITLLEVFFFGVMTAASVLQITQGNAIAQNIIIVLIFCFTLTVIAWNANELIFESSGLTTALYDSNWIKQSKSVNVIIQIMIMRCQQPLCITVGPFGPMTADTGVAQMKMAYSFLSLMTSIK